MSDAMTDILAEEELDKFHFVIQECINSKQYETAKAICDVADKSTIAKYRNRPRNWKTRIVELEATDVQS